MTIKVCPEGKVYNEVTKRCNKIKVPKVKLSVPIKNNLLKIRKI